MITGMAAKAMMKAMEVPNRILSMKPHFDEK
jgi:hypothetical protein